MEGDEAYDISDTMITNESQARTLEHDRLPTSWERQLAYKNLRFVQSIGNLDSGASGRLAKFRNGALE
jgi:hypothetical protein